MFFDHWGRWLRRLAQQVHGKPRNRKARRSRPCAESLEDRVTPSATAQIDSGGAQGQFTTTDNLTYHGGALISSVKVEPILLKDSSSHLSSPNQATIDGFFNSITSDQFIPNQLTPYDAGGYTIATGSKGTDDLNVPVTCDTTAAGFNSISDANIQTIITQEIAAGRTAGISGNTLYFVFTPPGDAVGDDFTGNSVQDFSGYHSAFFDGSSNVYYAVIPDPGAPNSSLLNTPISQGGWGFTNAQVVTAVSSHEMAESITDANPITGWHNPQGGSGEVGDLAAGQTYILDGYMTQYMWENSLLGPSHAPGASGNNNNIFINQLTPPAVTGLSSFPVATFTDPNPSDSLGNLTAEVDATYPGAGFDHLWTATISGGANGVYVVNATPSPALSAGQYGTGPAAGADYGLDVIIAAGATTVATRQVPFTLTASSTAFTYNADNGGLAHNFRLVQSGANLDLYDNGQLVFFQPISQTTTVNINADTGTSNSLTVDYSGGTFPSIHTITFDGGNGSGARTLTISGGSFTNETYTPSSASAGTFNLDGQSINFSDVASIADLASAVNFTASGSNSVDQINVGNGPAVNGAATIAVSGAHNTFAPVDFANKTTATVQGLSAANGYTVNVSTAATGLTTLDVMSGSTAGVNFTLQGTPAGVVTNVLGGAANVTANVGNAQSVQSIAGTLNLDDTVAAQLSVVVNDSSDAAGQTATLTSGKIHGLAPADINYVPTDTKSVTIDGGAGGNKFGILSVSTGLTTIINGGAGTNTFNVTPIATGANFTINGQGPTSPPGDKIVYGGLGTLNPAGPGAGTITQSGDGTVNFTGIATVLIGADPSQSTISIAPSSVASGSTATVTLTARDGNGNQLSSGGLTVTFGLGAGAGQGTFSAVTDNHNGTYSATFTATTAGTNTITGTISGAAVTSGLPTVTVTPGTVSLAQSAVSIAPASVSIGGTAAITLQAKDADGNDETSGGLSVTFGLGNGTGGGTIGAVTDNGDGTYSATFTGVSLGSNSVSAAIGGQQVTSPPATITITAGAASLSQSIVTIAPTSVASGSSATVTLQARDSLGNNEVHGGLTVAFGLGNGAASGAFGPVTDNGNGTYTATFTGAAEGSNTITATIGGQSVTSTPPSVTVTQGPASLSQSVVSVAPTSIQAGSTATVTLTARDANGVTEPAGGLTVLFGLGAGSGAGTFGAVTDDGNGTYTATFTGTLAGSVAITATINGQAVTSTAPNVTVTPGPVSLANSIVTLSPASIPAGGSTTVTLTAKDGFGNRETAGGLTVTFGLGGGNVTGSFNAVTDNHNGTYTATFTASALVGSNTITAAIGGQTVASAAPTLTVTAGPASLATSTVAIVPGSIGSGSAATVILTTRDASGNPEISGGLNVAFSLGAGTATGAFGPVTDNQNGTYSVFFTGAIEGTNTITATIGGQFLSSAAPSITVVPGPASLAQSIVSVAPGNVQAGSTATVTLLTRDAAGNNLTGGGLSVAFGLGAGVGSGTFSAFSDNGNGTYTATFTGATAGTNTITAAIGGQAVTSAAPAVTVTPGPFSLHASNVALAPATIQAAGATAVTLTARDAFGNQETSGGLSVVFGLGNGNVGGTFSAVTDNHNGTYSATFTTGTSVGSNTVTASIGGQSVTSIAPTLTVVPGAASLSQSTVAVSPASIQSGGSATVTLTATDAYGNQEQAGGLTVAFSLGAGSATGSFSTVVDNHNGTYTAAFTGALAGSSSITATIGGQLVTSSPAAISVTPGPVSLAASQVSVVPGSVQAGNSATVTLLARDAAGNQETGGGLSVAFNVGAGNATGSFGPVTDNHNGSYTATFTGDLAGISSLTASIAAQPVTSAAPTITVTPGPFSLATSTVTLNPSTIPAGGSTTVTLVAEDAFGNQEPAGGLSVAFGLGAGNIGGNFSAVTDHHNGTYTATFTAGPSVGSNTVTAAIAGSPVTSTPPSLTVIPAVYNVGQSTVSIAPAGILSGSTAIVTLVARDFFGNQESAGGLTVTFGLGAGAATGTFGPTIDHHDGTYTAVFTGALAGANTITAAIDGNALTSAPASVSVAAGPASASQSAVIVSPGSIQAGGAATVTLEARDAAGNDETTGGLNVAFALGAGAATGSFSAVTDDGNGTYTATFTGDLAGANTIAATINAQAVTSTSPTITVTPAPASAAQSVVTLSPSTIPAGGATTVTLTAKDAFGNQETSGGLGVTFGLGSNNITGAFSAVTDNGNGIYTALFTAGGAVGSSTITAAMSGAAVTSAPPTLTVTPATVSPSQSTLSAAPSSIASGSTAAVTLVTRDRFGNPEPSGGLTVTFGIGAGTGSFSPTVDNGNGTYSAVFTGVLAGTNTITATVSGQAVTSALPTISVVPGPVSAAQTIATIAPASVQVGGTASVTLQARDAAGNNETAGGLLVAFSLGAGAATGAFSHTIDNANGTYSAVFTGDTTGSSVLAASINGAPVTSTLPLVTVTQGNTRTLLTAAPASNAVFGENVTFTATVNPVVPGFGTPGGTVNFYDAGNPIGAGALAGGVATLTVSNLNVAGHNITASYVGDTQFAPSTSSLSYPVGPAATTTAVTASVGSSVFGQPVTISAAVTVNSPGAGAPANGDLVTFDDNGVSLGAGALAGGVATLTTGGLGVGLHTITAVFAGETDFAASTGALNGAASNNFTVAPAATTTTATASLPIAALGQAVTLTALVAADSPSAAPVRSGFVKFMDGAVSLNGPTGSPVGNGAATFTTSGLAVGAHSIIAVYSGAVDFAGSTSSAAPVVENVFQVTSLTVTSSLPAGGVYGQPMSLTANMTITPVGAGSLAGAPVTFESGTTILGVGTLSGSGTSYTASYTTTPTQLGVGADKITAVYDLAALGSIAPKSAAITQSVAIAHTTTVLTVPGASFFDQPTTFTATVRAVAPSTATPTGIVTFKDGATVLGSGALNASGIATFTTHGLAVGVHSITAVFGTTISFVASNSAPSSQSVSIAGTQTAVASAPNPSVFGQSVALTATVTATGGGVPTGSVTFLDGTTVLGKGTLNAAGIATFTTAPTQLALGDHSITAIYAGTAKAGFAGSTAPADTHTVDSVDTTTTLTASSNWSVGVPVSFTAVVVSVTGLKANAGTVTFTDSATGLTLGVANVSAGKAVFNFAGFTAVGIHSIVATYSGSANFNTSTNSAPLTESIVAVSLSASASPVATGTPVTIDAYVVGASATPVGYVRIYDDGKFLSFAYVNQFGIASLKLTDLAVGTHDFTALYSGDGNYNPGGAATPLAVVVTPRSAGRLS